MNEFHFASPNFLFALPVLLLLLLFVRFQDRRVRDRLSRFLHYVNLSQLLQDRGTVSERGKKLAYWLGLVLLVLALARPQANPVVEEAQSSGLDVYVLLDVSRSMDSEDVPPSRLKKAKRTIQHLAARLSGDRLGIIAFANSSVVVTPLTNDYSIIESYLKNIDTGIVPSQGTNFANALETARDAMERGAKNTSKDQQHSNIFLILSDGEDQADSDLSIVDRIKKEGGLVFTIAFGTEKGSLIPIRDDKGVLKGYKKDSAGNEVVTKVEPKTLAEIAKRGGGQFYHSTQDEAEVEDVLARVNDAQRGSFATVKTTVWEELFWMFLGPAIFLLLLSFVPLRAIFPAESRGRGWLRRLKPGAAILLVAFLPGRAQAGPISFFWDKDRKASEQSAALAREQKFGEAADTLKPLQADNPDSPEINYDIGTYLLADKKGRLGREQLSHLRNADGILRDLATFNTAGSYALEGKKDEARAAYADLIAHLERKSKLSGPESNLLEQAKRNVARLADPAQQPQPQKDQSEKQDQNQDQKQDQKQGGGGGDSKDQKQGGGDDKKDQKKEGKGEGDQKKDQGKGEGDSKDRKKDEGKGEGDQKNGQDKKGDDKKDQGKGGDDKKDQGKGGEGDKDKQPQNKGGDNKQGPQNQGQMPRGGQPFKERDDMGEQEAKRILGALKERESELQKKLLKNAVKGGRVNVDDAGKDW